MKHYDTTRRMIWLAGSMLKRHDPVCIFAKDAVALNAAKELERQTLASGALPGEFRVILDSVFGPRLC